MIVHATYDDLEIIDDIAKRAILAMNQDNIPQWDLSYPRKAHFELDIKAKSLYIYKEESKICGMMVMRQEHDPPYETITGWTVPHGKSIVLHRCVVDPALQRQGVFRKMMEFAIEYAKQHNYRSIKIDTHGENYKMRRFLESIGFTHIGYLNCINREAYELVWEDQQ